jgi:excisionase family DNA binding protein
MPGSSSTPWFPRAGSSSTSEPRSSVAGENKRRFLTVEQVAEELNVGLPLVRGLLRTGELRGIQIGGRGLWRVATTDLEDYISQAYMQTATRVASGELATEADPEP